MTSPRPVLLALLCSLPAGGCCSLARFFCGPDSTPWVRVSYDTPRDALATFLESIRREDVGQVYRSLADDYKRRLGGATELEVELVYQHMKQEIPGLHMAGYAEVPAEPARRQDRGVTYELDVYGHRLRVDLVRQAFWRVRYRDDEGGLHSVGIPLPHDSFNANVRVVPAGEDPIDGDPRSRVELRDLLVVHPSTNALRVDQIDEVTIAREWLVDGLAADEPAPARQAPPVRDPLGT